MIGFLKTHKSHQSIDDGYEKTSSQSSYQSDKVFAAVFYAVTSFAVVFVNKGVMVEFNFGYFDFLAFFQFLVTSMILSLLIVFKKIEVPLLTWDIIKEIFPISLMFLGNIVCGLGGTRSLNLPMFTALRRFTILLTMTAEYFILNVKPSKEIILSVFMMVGGALLAALYDIQFDLLGYSLVFLNDLFTASNGVYIKKASLSGRVNKMGILFYSSLFSAIIMFFFFMIEYYTVVYLNNTNHHHHLILNRLNMDPIIIRPANTDNSIIPRLLRITDPSPSIVGLKSVSIQPLIIPLISPPPPQHHHQQQQQQLQQQQLLFTSEATPRSVLRWLHFFDLGDVMISPMKAMGGHTDATSSSSTTSTTTTSANTVTGGTGMTSSSSSYSSSSSLYSSHDIYSTIYEVYHHPAWQNPTFLVGFTLAATMGSILNYSIFLCTTLNSALTTGVIGCLKNILTSYVGMMVFSDYKFAWLNFIGLNISITGSLYYTYMTIVKGMKGFGGG